MTTVALSVTKEFGPEPIFPGYKIAKFKIGLPTASNGWTATGVPVDVSSYFSTIQTAWIGDVDTYADMAYKWGCVITNDGATPASDLRLSAHYSTTAGGAMTPVPTNADLSAVTTVSILVIGT